MKKLITYRTVFFAFIAVYVAAGFLSESPTCVARAYDDTREFCLVTEITVTNTGSADLTDQPVRVLLPAKSLISGDQFDERGWDAFPVIGAVNNEVPVFQQSLTSTQAPYWFNIDSLPAGDSRTIQLYTGANRIRTDNGIRFTGNEYLTVADHADFDITDNLRIDVLVQADTTDPITGVVVDKLNELTGDGYEVSFFYSVGTQIAGFTINSSFVTFPYTPTGGVELLTFEYIAAAGNDAFFYVDGSLESAVDTDAGPIGTNSTDLFMGLGNGGGSVLADVTLFDVKVSEAGIPAGHWGFDARRTQETNSTYPYLGTTDDYSGNGHTASYTFERDQSDVTFQVGVISPNTFTPPLSLNEGNSVVGAPVPTGFETARPTVTTGVIYTNVVAPLQNVATATGAPAEGVIAAFFFGVSLALAVVVWKLTNGYMPAAVMTLGIGPTIAVILGYVAEWWLILWGLTAVMVWFAQLRSQQES